MKHDAHAVAAEIGHEAEAVMDQAKVELGKAADNAKGMAAEQKDFVSRQIEDVAAAVDKVAGELEGNDATTAGYARTLADSVGKLSETIKTKDVNDLLAMVEDFGRKQPVAFMGAAALMGFAASRFLVASAHHRSRKTGGGGDATAVRSAGNDTGTSPYTSDNRDRSGADRIGGLS